MTLRWINSTGGPLVLVPERHVARWRGVDDEGADYELARAVEGFIGVANWRHGPLLVFGDDPNLTARWDQAGELVFVRWIYAPDEGAVISFLERGDWGAPLESLPWLAEPGQHILFDAASSGEDAGDRIEIEVSGGRYEVTTHVAETSSLGLMIHVFHHS